MEGTNLDPFVLPPKSVEEDLGMGLLFDEHNLIVPQRCPACGLQEPRYGFCIKLIMCALSPLM
jgi:hypothetical protein